jgi:hypothetical protein
MSIMMEQSRAHASNPKQLESTLRAGSAGEGLGAEAAPRYEDGRGQQDQGHHDSLSLATANVCDERAHHQQHQTNGRQRHQDRRDAEHCRHDQTHSSQNLESQGGCQAIEDAVALAATVGSGDRPVRDTLPAYTEARLGRTTDIARRSRRAGRLYQAPPFVARAAARAMNLIPASVIARGLAPILDWQPPE